MLPSARNKRLGKGRKTWPNDGNVARTHRCKRKKKEPKKKKKKKTTNTKPKRKKKKQPPLRTENKSLKGGNANRGHETRYKL